MNLHTTHDKMFLLGIILAAMASFLLYTISVVPYAISFLGLGIIWISILPSFIFLSQKAPPSVPFFPVTGIYYAIFFGLPIFTLQLSWADANSIVLYTRVKLEEIHPEILMLILCGILTMVLVFYIFRYVIFPKMPRLKLGYINEEPGLKFLLWVLMAIHISYELTPSLKALGSIGQFAKPVGYLALGGLYLMWRRKTFNKLESLILLCVCLPLIGYLRIRYLFLTDMIFLVLFFIFVLWRERQFRLLSFCVTMALILIFLYGATAAVRHSAESTTEKLKFLGEAVYWQLILGQKVFVPNPDVNMHEAEYSDPEEQELYYYRTFHSRGRLSALVERTGQTWVFHSVADRSPQPIPYWQGESYRPLFTSFIPRIFYPNKPKEETGGEFGRRYYFMKADDIGSSSVNLPWLTELLTNFGRWGVIWGMALIGIFLAFLDRLFNSRKASDIEFIIGLTIIFPLTYPESNFSVMTGSMLPLFLAVILYFSGGLWITNKILFLVNRK